MRKILLIMAMGALVCWLPGQALATSYTSTYTSTLNTLGTNTDLPTLAPGTNYGTVFVGLTSDDEAQVIITLNSAYFRSPSTNNDAIALNVALAGGTSLSVFNGGSGNFIYTVTAGSTQTVDGLGTFDVTGYTNTADQGSLNYVVTITNGGGVWASAADVLVGNTSGFDAAADIVEVSNSGEYGFVGESVVPLPSTALLLGSGLLGMALLGFRRKRTAFQL